MPSPITLGFLRARGASYDTVSHAEAFTAQQTAAAAHVAGRALAKTVMVKIDSRLAMVVVPSTCRVDLESVREACGAQEAQLATEDEFRFRFPDCDLGAMPPLGNLYDLPVYVCRGMASNTDIYFNGGSHTQLVRISFDEFVELAKPTLIEVACGAAEPRCQQ
jgi:Ala-tRNA(Pro) deacylase